MKNLVTILKYMAGLVIGLGLFYLAFRGMNFEKMKSAFRAADYWWVLVGALIAIPSVVFRALRWKMLLRAAGHESNSGNLFAAIMVGYLANQAIPRAGEISRATMASRSERIPFSVSFGTVVSDRIFDVICLGLLVIFVFVMELDKLLLITEEAFSETEPGTDEGSGIPWKWILIAFFAAAAAAFALLRKKIRNSKLGGKIWQFASDMIRAVISVRKMRNAPLFVIYTTGIWLSYIMMSYVCFFAFDNTAGMGFYIPLLAFIMGAIGMVFPSPGGIGSYHYGFSLIFWAYWAEIVATMSSPGATAEFDQEATRGLGVLLATIIHGSQMLMIIAIGFISWLYMAVKLSRTRVESP